MRIYLNLLPPEKKQEISKKKRARAIIKQEIMLAFPLVVFIAFLFCLNLILKIQEDGFDQLYAMEQSKEEYRRLKSYEDKFQEVNEKSGRLSELETKHLRWSRVLASLEKSLPAEIKITDLSSKDYKILLAGKADKRENLLKFQENIINSECFENAEIPLSNLVIRENVEFQIDFEVKEKCLLSGNYE